MGFPRRDVRRGLHLQRCGRRANRNPVRADRHRRPDRRRPDQPDRQLHPERRIVGDAGQARDDQTPLTPRPRADGRRRRTTPGDRRGRRRPDRLVPRRRRRGQSTVGDREPHAGSRSPRRRPAHRRGHRAHDVRVTVVALAPNPTDERLLPAARPAAGRGRAVPRQRRCRCVRAAHRRRRRERPAGHGARRSRRGRAGTVRCHRCEHNRRNRPDVGGLVCPQRRRRRTPVRRCRGGPWLFGSRSADSAGSTGGQSRRHLHTAGAPAVQDRYLRHARADRTEWTSTGTRGASSLSPNNFEPSTTQRSACRPPPRCRHRCRTPHPGTDGRRDPRHPHRQAGAPAVTARSPGDEAPPGRGRESDWQPPPAVRRAPRYRTPTARRAGRHARPVSGAVTVSL